jgi:integrase/recombinase XerD
MKASLYLDQRHQLQNGKFPVKVQVSSKEGGKWKQRYFATGECLSPKEWETVKTGKVRGPLRKIRETILAKESRAQDIIKTSPFISLDSFEAIFTRARSNRLNVQELYGNAIEQMLNRNQYSNSVVYTTAKKMFLDRFGSELTLDVIDKDFLLDLESKLAETMAKATIGIRLRTLRKIFNDAVEDKLITMDRYPFGRRGYVIPSGKAFKRALVIKDKNKLVNFKPKLVEWRTALDVWMFSYYCNGMNMADIAKLKKDKLRGTSFSYVRKKKAFSQRVATPLTVTVRSEVRRIIDRYPGEYMFNVLKGEETAEQERKLVNQWTKTTNKYLKRIGDKLKLEFKLTTYVARHTGANVLRAAGADLSELKDLLGHADIKTTDIYMASIRAERQKKLAAKL